MVHKVNTKARIQRHLRIYKENGINNRNKRKINNFNFNIVFFFVVILFPIYPTLASFIHGNSQYEFYRWDIDESSILGSFYWDDNIDSEYSKNAPILESNDSYFTVTTILDTTRNLSGTNEIVNYEVQPGESFSIIAEEFEVTQNSILWANNFKKGHILQPWNIIKIPPVSGLIHQIKKWDTISSIAKKYKINENDILKQNLLTKDEWLSIWEELVLPGAKKVPKVPKVVISKPRTTYTRSTNTFVAPSLTGQWAYKLIKRRPYSGVVWNCTWYVASYTNVNWRWNANQWLSNARKAGQLTWSTPQVWSIVSFDGRGYNRRYGHVAIVMEVKSDYIIVSDMNYRRLYEVTYRKIMKNDRAIQWYIYVK